MTTAADYRLYAQRCLENARASTSDPDRKQLLDQAQLWTKAAEHMEARLRAGAGSPGLTGAQPRQDKAVPDSVAEN